MIQKLSFFNYHLRLHQRFLGKNFCNKKNHLFYKTFHLTSLILKYDIAPFAFTSWNINRHHFLFLLICAAIRNIPSSFMKDLFLRRLRIDSERTWHLKKTIELIGKISERWFTTFLVYRWLSKRSFLFFCLSFLFTLCLQKLIRLVFWYFFGEEWLKIFHPSGTLNRGICETHRKLPLISARLIQLRKGF